MEICEADRKTYVPPLVATAVWFAAYFGARLLLKLDVFSPWQRIGISLIPIPFFLWFVWLFVRNMRQADELQKRIQLESLAIAFPLSVVLLMTLGLLQKATELSPNAWSYAHVWLYLPMFYTFGNAIAAHRYR